MTNSGRDNAEPFLAADAPLKATLKVRFPKPRLAA